MAAPLLLSMPVIKGKASWMAEEDMILSGSSIISKVHNEPKLLLNGLAKGQTVSLALCQKRGEDKEAMVIALHEHHVSGWANIAKQMPSGSDNDVKNLVVAPQHRTRLTRNRIAILFHGAVSLQCIPTIQLS